MDFLYPNAILSYAELLRKFNPAINLLSRKDMDNLMVRHIDDAIFSHSVLLDNKGISSDYSIYDLGSGNGIPGLVWAILSPETRFYLVDTDERKCEFLKTVASRLGLHNITVVTSDFKALAPNPEAKFLCRGLTSIHSFLSAESPFKALEGYFIKGSTWNIEIGSFSEKLFSPLDYKLKDGTKRTLVIYKN